MKWISLSLITVLIVLGTCVALGQWRWRTLTQDLMERIEGAREPVSPVKFNPEELRHLPPPVQRYFMAAIADGTAMVATVSLAHSGDFNMGEAADQWRTFSSTQKVVMRRPGFVWDGRISMLPGVPVHVHDAYVAGEGFLRPAIAGLIDLADLRGGDEISQGELLRFLAEAAWYPTALLPSQGVHWAPIDAHSARATLKESKHSADLTFVFGADGLIQSVRAEARGRMVAGVMVATPWEGRWSHYAWRDGLRVPTRGEVAWLLPQGRKPYWRGTLTALHYKFAGK